MRLLFCWFLSAAWGDPAVQPTRRPAKSWSAPPEGAEQAPSRRLIPPKMKSLRPFRRRSRPRVPRPPRPTPIPPSPGRSPRCRGPRCRVPAAGAPTPTPCRAHPSSPPGPRCPAPAAPAARPPTAATARVDWLLPWLAGARPATVSAPVAPVAAPSALDRGIDLAMDRLDDRGLPLALRRGVWALLFGLIALLARTLARRIASGHPPGPAAPGHGQRRPAGRHRDVGAGGFVAPGLAALAGGGRHRGGGCPGLRPILADLVAGVGGCQRMRAPASSCKGEKRPQWRAAEARRPVQHGAKSGWPQPAGAQWAPDARQLRLGAGCCACAPRRAAAAPGPGGGRGLALYSRGRAGIALGG